MIPPDGPYFDDFTVGETLDPAPAITIGAGSGFFACASSPPTIASK